MKCTKSVVIPNFRKPRLKGAWRNGVWIKSSKKNSKQPKRRKQIARKARFKSHENTLKTYERKRSPEETKRYALHCQSVRLSNPTPAETAFAEILDRIGSKYEREKIFFYGDRFALADFYLPEMQIIIECDGQSHREQKRHDVGRDRYFNGLGIRTIRFDNRAILKTPETVEAIVRKLIS